MVVVEESLLVIGGIDDDCVAEDGAAAVDALEPVYRFHLPSSTWCAPLAMPCHAMPCHAMRYVDRPVVLRCVTQGQGGVH
jgi:hypothetical protein